MAKDKKKPKNMKEAREAWEKDPRDIKADEQGARKLLRQAKGK